jgi:hypothetical protein
MALHCLGDGHDGTLSQNCRWVPVPLRRRRQIHQVGVSNPCGHDQQVDINQVYKVICLSLQSTKPGHHRQCGIKI